MAVPVTYTKTARGQFSGLEQILQRKFADALSEIARDPLHPPYWLDVEPIRGMMRGWRHSLEGYRATYCVERTKLVVLDLQPGHEIYRKRGTPEV
jgi:mRNA-degrading endonuclease RelE of RelBE toxin-antitoxin system